MEKTLESNNPLSTTEMRARINDLNDAWFKFVDQYDRLLIISGRGRLFGLRAYYTDLIEWYFGYRSGWLRILEMEQAKEAALTEDQEIKAEGALNELKDEEHDDTFDDDDTPFPEDLNDTFDDDNSSLGEEEEARLNKAIKEQKKGSPDQSSKDEGLFYWATYGHLGTLCIR